MSKKKTAEVCSQEIYVYPLYTDIDRTDTAC